MWGLPYAKTAVITSILNHGSPLWCQSDSNYKHSGPSGPSYLVLLLNILGPWAPFCCNLSQVLSEFELSFLNKNWRVAVEAEDNERDYGRHGCCVRAFEEEGVRRIALLTTEGMLHVSHEQVAPCLEKRQKHMQLRTFERVSHETKVALLLDWGWWLPEESCQLTPVSATKPKQLMDEHIWLWHAMLAWSLPQVSVMRWHPHFLHRLWAECENAGPLRERLCAAIGKGWEKFEWHLFPIFAPLLRKLA